jgi:SOS response associated peptidase (SRAP)
MLPTTKADGACAGGPGYVLGSLSSDDLGRFFRVSHNRRTSFQPVDAIFPRHVAPVVRQSGDGEREIVLMSWGFIRLERNRAPKPVTNVRDDQIKINPFWRDSFRRRRCLVPVSSFCEPNGDVKPATWHSHVCGQARTQPLVRSQSTGPWGQVQIGRQGEELSAKRQSINLSFAG